jgi:hypothetical protein
VNPKDNALAKIQDIFVALDFDHLIIYMVENEGENDEN